MQNGFGRLCYSVRKSAGYSQERAAEIFGVSVRSMQAYETGETKVPDDIVLKMLNTYNAPLLGYAYLRQCTMVGAVVLPDIKIKGLAESILDLQYHADNMGARQHDLIDVGRDNDIDTDEQSTYRRCIDTLSSLIGAAYAVMLAPVTTTKRAQKKTAPAPTGNGLMQKIFSRSL